MKNVKNVTVLSKKAAKGIKGGLTTYTGTPGTNQGPNQGKK